MKLFINNDINITFKLIFNIIPSKTRIFIRNE